MYKFRILPNGFIKTYFNNEYKSLLFNTKLQYDGLIQDGYIQI